MEVNLDSYKIELKQLSPINFFIQITTPENLKFFSNLQCNPAQLNRDSILQNFLDKNTRKNWTIELEKTEVDTNITPNISPEIKI